jgi:hypothetical protein
MRGTEVAMCTYTFRCGGSTISSYSATPTFVGSFRQSAHAIPNQVRSMDSCKLYLTHQIIPHPQRQQSSYIPVLVLQH